MSDRLRLILDVDTGTDDALALAYAVSHPDVELVAVTTVAGNTGIDLTTANTLAVLDWLGAHEVPVHRGASRPLARPHRDAIYFHH
jgi:inosine-uridine nucleoside N-ribohydrolase